jgi:phage terminase large subunit-like protein
MKMNKLENMSDKELLNLAESLKVLDEKKRYNKQEFLWPMYTKPGYEKHMMFFEAGAVYKERALIAGNRTGKTHTASAENSFHANGRYPSDWKGKTFNKPVNIWCIGQTHDTTRDILQKYLLGSRYDIGSGFIPKEDIERVTSKPGIQDAIQDAHIKHYTKGVFDGYSHIQFKSYVQGVEAFMGTAQDVIHLDEEPYPVSIYTECLIRTMTTDGIIMCTFTPKMGLSEVVLSFAPGGKFPPNGYGEVKARD